MAQDIATATTAGEVMEAVIIKGDLGKLTPEQRSDYYMAVCKSVGLNPLTKPFEYITLNGKLTLYALRACTDQLRQIHGISIEVVDRIESEGLMMVHVRAKNKDGRQDEDYGAVPFVNLKGEAAANAIMKCVTKAKRRATLSLCGLGWLDETEIETVKDARPYVEPERAETVKVAPPKSKPTAPVTAAPIHPETGEVSPHAIHLSSKDGKFDWIGWGQSYLAALKSAKDGDECQAWVDANAETLKTMKGKSPDIHKRLMAAVSQTIGLGDPQAGDVPDKQVATAEQGDII